MSIKGQIEADLKQAMLAGDKTLVTTLRGLKSAIQYAEVAAGTQGQADDDAAVTTVMSKEAKKRQESADLYKQGGNEERAAAELAEKTAIEKYLPEQMSEADVQTIVNEVIQELGASSQQQMGQVIGKVRERTLGKADGSVIARLVKAKLS
jgi:uncharacterized protein YqeY